SNRLELLVGEVQRRVDLLRAADDHDLFPWSEEVPDAGPGVADDRRAAGRSLEQPARGTPAATRHRLARDIQRQPRTGIEIRMIVRRQVPHEVDVLGPRERLGIPRTGYDEAPLRPPP